MHFWLILINRTIIAGNGKQINNLFVYMSVYQRYVSHQTRLVWRTVFYAVRPVHVSEFCGASVFFAQTRDCIVSKSISVPLSELSPV